MGSKSGTGRLYKSSGRTVYVASGNGGCPTINLAKIGAARVRDDFSTGFKAHRTILKAVFG